MKIKNLFRGYAYMNTEGGTGGSGGDNNPPPASPPATPPSVFGDVAPEYMEKLTASGIKDVPSLVKQFADLQSHLGNSIRVPSEHASDEDRAKFIEKLQRHAPNLMPRPDKTDAKAMGEFYRSLGRPEDPSKYPVEVPEEIKHLVSQDRLTQIQKVAFDAGLSAEQFKAMVDADIASTKTQFESSKTAAEQDKSKLKEMWGDAYSRNLKIVADMAQATGAPQALVELAKAGEINSDIANWMYQLSAQVSTKEGSTFKDAGGSGTMTPSEAQSRIDEILNNRSHPYWVASHPDHRRAIQTMIELAGYADPTAARDINNLRANRSA
ncbi:MAG: hypothetical protein [Podoviridae sp. ctpVR23]|nr:MAG: hypothetical protein [Podoviridae sp. ctpVR23]